MQHRCLILICAVLVIAGWTPARAQISAHDRLTKLAQDITFTTARRYPMNATALGIPGYDGDLETPSEAYRAASISLLRQWQAQLQALGPLTASSPSLADRDDAKLLAAQLTGQLNLLLVYQPDRKDYSAPANNVINAIFTQFLNLPIAGQNGATQADLTKAWSDITSRLAKAPQYINAGQKLVTMPGHLYGVIGSGNWRARPVSSTRRSAMPQRRSWSAIPMRWLNSSRRAMRRSRL